MNVNWTKSISRIFAFVAFAVLIVSCDPIGVKKNSELSLTLNPESAGKDAGKVSVVVRADGAWSLELDFGGDEAWAELSHSVGTGYKSNIKLSYDANKTGASRSVYVIVSTENDAAEVRFTQTADDAGPDGGKADATSCGWMELPETKSGDGLLWAWHTMTTGSKRVRNYSFYWSSTEHLALWVAYPLNKGLIGGGDRTNKWDIFDPLIPRSEQANTWNGGFGSGYDRGHQLPSADRLYLDGNVQTFYPTNMTPQRSQFNQNIWAKLEGTVRSWANSLNSATDTLYVVTGCVVNGSTSSRQAGRSGPYVTVPTAYYKALLRYSRSSGYSGCAIWLDHETDPLRTADERDMMSIAALEEKLGIDLFVNLPAKVGDAKAAEIEAKAPTVNTWPL